jgi:HK97 family phage major capsid protein
MPMTVDSYEALREQKQARMDAINKTAADEGRTKSDAEREEFRQLDADIVAIDAEVQDLKRMDAIAKRAVPVNGNGAAEAAGSRSTAQVWVKHEKPEPGMQFAQLAMAQAKAKGNPAVAQAILQRHYPNHPAVGGLKLAADQGEEYGAFIGKLADLRTKAAVDGGTTAAGSWAAALLAHNDYAGDFLEYLRAETIVGKFGQAGVADFTRIPFNVTIKGQNAGGLGYWVGEGQPKPVTKFGFTDAYHGFNKLAAISVISEELIRFSDPSAERLVRNALAAAVVETMDKSFVDDTVGSASRPAGLLYGLTPIASEGADFAAIQTDIKALWTPAITAKLPLSGAVYVTTPAIAMALSLMHGEVNESRLFPNMTIRGGSLLGIPVIVSDYVAEGDVILVFAPEIYMSDDGVVTVDASREASIQMLDNPTNASSDLHASAPAPTATTMVSMFQTNNVALRAERYINWSKRRAAAATVLSGVEWGAPPAGSS